MISPVDRVYFILPVLLGPRDGGQGVVGDGGQGPLLPPGHQPLQHLNLQIFPIRRPSLKLPWRSLRWLPLVFKVFKLKSLFQAASLHKEAKSVPKLADVFQNSQRALYLYNVHSGRPPIPNCRAGGTWRRCSSKPPPPPQPASTSGKLSPSRRYLRTPL